MSTLSTHEPAARTVPLILSEAEVAAVILFHHRQRQRIARLAGQIALGLCPEADHLPAKAKASALETCQDQSAAHEARSFELAALLKRSSKQPPSRHSAN